MLGVDNGPECYNLLLTSEGPLAAKTQVSKNDSNYIAYFADYCHIHGIFLLIISISNCLEYAILSVRPSSSSWPKWRTPPFLMPCCIGCSEINKINRHPMCPPSPHLRKKTSHKNGCNFVTKKLRTFRLVSLERPWGVFWFTSVVGESRNSRKFSKRALKMKCPKSS